MRRKERQRSTATTSSSFQSRGRPAPVPPSSLTLRPSRCGLGGGSVAAPPRDGSRVTRERVVCPNPLYLGSRGREFQPDPPRPSERGPVSWVGWRAKGMIDCSYLPPVTQHPPWREPPLASRDEGLSSYQKNPPQAPQLPTCVERKDMQRPYKSTLSCFSVWFRFFGPSSLLLQLPRSGEGRVSKDSCRIAGSLGESMKVLARERPLQTARTKLFSAVALDSQRAAGRLAKLCHFACPPTGKLSLPFQGLILENCGTHSFTWREWPLHAL